MLTLCFVSLGTLIAVKTRDKARAVGIALAVWAVMVIVYDALLLWGMIAFGDRPVEPFVVPIAALNPIDLARIMVMLKVDLAAMMGYSGAIYKLFFGSLGGMLLAAIALALWVLLPAWCALRAFDRKDL
jgi:Cu-processing system permease protein